MNTSKIIKAYIGAGTYSTTDPITQGDYGYILQIEGTVLPATYRVDFANDRHEGEALTVYGNENGAEVPEELIATGKDIFAFYYYIGENFGKTAYTWKIPNDTRAKNGDRTPTPTQQDSIDQLIVRSNEAVTRAEQSASAAGQSAQSAVNSAIEANRAELSAKSHALNAEQSSINADLSANDASESAEASAQSANQAAQIKSDVEGLAEDARDAANSSEISARASGESALAASNSALSSGEYASNALGYAESASESAQTASTKASEASQSATTALDKATESAQSASQALSHKTDAESAKTASQTAQGLAEQARDTAVSAKTDAESARDEAQNIVDGISAKAEQIDANTASVASLEEDRYKPYAVDTASGAVASFTDGADNIPLKSLVVDINPVQDLSHGDPSPENVCPISGWTGCEVTQISKNLYDDTQPLLAGILGTDGSLNGVSASTNKHTYKIPIKAGATYTYSVSVTRTSNMNCCVYNEGNTAIDNFVLVRNTTSITFIAPINAVSVSLSIYNVNGQQIQLEVGDSSTEKIDYATPTNIPISWQTEAGTVYGGKLDVLTGKLTVYPYYDSYNGETLTGEWISDRDVYAVGTTPTIGAQVVNIGAEGTEIQLEPYEVASLLGVNNIFADTGDCAVEYRADTKLFIERLTAPDSADMIADANITSGQYFMVGNNLYKATANIANGGQIVVGTNATRVSLAQALNEINT